MNHFNETSISPPETSIKSDRPVGVEAPKLENPEIPKVNQSEVPPWVLDGKYGDHSSSELSDIFNSAFKSFGLASETNEEGGSETSETSEKKDYSEYLEKDEDGKYHDKETGRVYDSVEDWVKAQETLVKRYESTAQFYEEKAKKEWARFKNAEQNGESDGEKWEHYRRSQEYYSKAKDCQEKAAHIREKINSLRDVATPVNEVGRKDHLDVEGSFSSVPVERQEAVYKAFENAPDEIKALVNQYANI